MTDINLGATSSGFNLSTINDNFEVIEDAINTEILHLVGGNNVMRQAIDMNSNQILNLAEPTTPNSPARLQDVLDAVSGGIDDAGEIVYTPAGTGAVGTTVEAKLRERVSVKDFGAVCDGSTDDSAAIQAAIDYCSTFDQWPTLVIPGVCRLASTLYIDRPVDNQESEFRIVGEGEAAGFYTSSGITMFDSTISMSTSPVSEFVTFENIRFSTANYSDETFVVSKKFLRLRFVGCFFWLVRVVVSDTYVQTIYFNQCNIRNNHTNFINCEGLYDVTFNSCVIENGQTIVRCIDVARGCSGLRFIDCVIEGIGSSIVVATGLAGFTLMGSHLETNAEPQFNFWGGSLTNESISIISNFIFSPSGDICYYGPTNKVFSAGNDVIDGVLHTNVVHVAELVSVADNCVDGISDATNYSTINGVYRAGTSAGAWTDSGSHITKSSSGDFGIGIDSQSTSKLLVLGKSSTSSDFALKLLNSSGNEIATFRNDRLVTVPALQNFANDAAASAGSIPVGGLYRNGSVVMVRVS